MKTLRKPTQPLQEAMKALAHVPSVSAASPLTRKLVVMLPALNEEKTIADVLGRIPRQMEGFDEVELLVIDDGSSDATVKLAKDAGAKVVKTTGCSRDLAPANTDSNSWLLLAYR